MRCRRHISSSVGLAAVLWLLGCAAAPAVQLIDGARDAEYSLVASNLTDPAHKLVVDALASPAINDPADPRANTLLVTGLWAANSGTDLYLFIDMPNLDLNVIEGEWCVVFHLRGANDGLQRTGAPRDPYDAACDFGHAPACNAVLKSNMAGFKHDYDGNQGWAFLVPVNSGLNDWDWENSAFLGNPFDSSQFIVDTANNLVHGIGATGGEIVYKGGVGIEVKIPLGLFGVNPSATSVTPPKVGDEILMQFYDNMRNRGTPRYPRGPVDSVPFEAAGQGNAATHDYSRGYVTRWASYTLKAPPTLEVTGASLRLLTDLDHIQVAFSSAVADGAGTPGNYAIVNTSTGAAFPVSAAQVDPADGSKVTLSVAVPFSTRVRVTVSTSVMGVNGAHLSSLKNTAELSIGTPVQFNLCDPHGIVAAAGANPDTGQPYRITMTGSLINWANWRPPKSLSPENPSYGWNEIPLTQVAGEPNHYRSPVVVVAPGVMGYKYCFPEMPDSGPWDGWNALNPNDRTFFVPKSSTVVPVNNNAAGSYMGVLHEGPPVALTFTLIDKDNLADGKPVYVTGTFNGWSADPSVAVAMAPVAGEPNTFSATFEPNPGNGADITLKYKYITIDGVSDPWANALNPFGDHWGDIGGTGTPLAQKFTDFLGSTKTIRILRVVAGVGPAPQYSGYYGDLDVDFSGSITFMDAVQALRAVSLPSLPRLSAQGTKIADPSGNEVKLRGFNLGGWFVEEMWMTPWVQDPPAGSPYPRVVDHSTLWPTLAQRLGAASAQNVKAAYRNAWIQSTDFQRIKAAGFNHVRLPFIYDIVDEPGGMDWLRNAVSAANLAGLYVILDMHGAPGSQNGWDHSGTAGPVLFFSSTANIAKAIQVWTAIASEFGSNPGVLGFDLMNEPAGAPDVTTLHAVHNQMYQAIRAVAPNTIVIVEDGYKGVSSLPQPGVYGWANVVYSIHLYDFGAASPQDHLNSLNSQLPGILQVRASRNVPIYIGEFNLEPNNSSSAMSAYTNTMSTNGLSWTLWTYKTVATGGPMGYWGYYSNPGAVIPLDPFRDSESTLIGKLSQVRTESLAIPAGLAAALAPPGT